MSDQGNVAIKDTLELRNEIVVTTEENQPEEGPDPKAEPSASDDGKSKTPAATAATKDEAQPRRDRRSEREIRRLKKELAEEKSARKVEADKLDELAQTVDSLKANTQPKKAAPELKDFETSIEFGKAYAAWERDQAEPAPAKKPDPPKPEPKTQAPDPFEDDRVALMKSGIEKYGDEFNSVMAPGPDQVPISMDMRDFIFDSEAGPELIMYFDDHRDEAVKIYQQGPTASAKAMERIEAAVKKNPPDREGEIRAEAHPADDPPPKKTKQPEPPETLKTSTTPGAKSLDDMNMDDYAEKRLADQKRERIR